MRDICERFLLSRYALFLQYALTVLGVGMVLYGFVFSLSSYEHCAGRLDGLQRRVEALERAGGRR